MPKKSIKKPVKTLKSSKKALTRKVGSSRKNLFNENYLSNLSVKLPSFESFQTDLKKNQNLFNMVLGGLIVILFGILLFNFFNKPGGSLGPAGQTSIDTSKITADNKKEDIAKDNLPGPYTIKDGDTLYLIAQKYYGDGFLYNKIAEANNLSDPDLVEVGQVITLPKVEANNTAQNTPTLNADSTQNTNYVQGGTGGAENETIWGERITGDTYTVQTGDWLSKVAGRAYGDIYAFDKIAKANNISDPNNIEVGTVLTIPR